MTYFDDLFNELNQPFFNDDFNQAGQIPVSFHKQTPMPTDATKAPTKKAIGVDLVAQAKKHHYDPVIGRDQEMASVIEILSRRKKHNPVLIGPAGVGKTAIVEGLAEKIASGKVPAKLKKVHIIALNINDLVAGSALRGSFEKRLKQIIDQAQHEPNLILFIDELHNIVGAGSTDSENNNGDAANILKPALASGDLRVIGATTTSEYQRIEHDPALARRFQAVQVGEPSIAATVKILQGLKPKYEQFHHVKYSDESLKLAVTLSQRYIQGRFLPDKAIDLMDEVGAKKSLSATPRDETALKNQLHDYQRQKSAAVQKEDYQKASDLKAQCQALEQELKQVTQQHTPQVTAQDVYQLLEEKTHIPMSEDHPDNGQKDRDLSRQLKQAVIDQDQAIEVITDAIARKQVFKETDRPTGTFLLTGPTGVGKTELAKQLALKLFGAKTHLIRLDMSEYQDEMAVNKLIGAAPGYVGYGEGGQLTEKVRHQPYSLILLDEIEKANPQIFNALLQIMDDGRLTDAQGHTVSFKDTIIVMTSNAGYSDHLLKAGASREDLLKALKAYFKPEFLNRLDAIVPFNALTAKDMTQILTLYLQKMAHTLAKRQVQLTVDQKAKTQLSQKGFSPEYGARPLRRVVEQMMETPVAKLLMSHPKTTTLAFTADDQHLYLNGAIVADFDQTASHPQ